MYPAINDMDGCYHQVKRGNKMVKLCFSDLTDEERRLVTNGYDYEAMLRLAGHLADRLHRAGTTIHRFREKMFHVADEEADPE